MDTPHNPSLPRIFVSHSANDNEFAAWLVADLRRILDDESAVWDGVQNRIALPDGAGWTDNTLEEIIARNIFLVILSPDTMASVRVNNEIGMALKQRCFTEGELIVPLLYRECEIREELKILPYVSLLPPKY